MTLDEALEKGIAKTGHERFRYLCLEHPDEATRAKHVAYVMAKASGQAMGRGIVSASRGRVAAREEVIPLADALRRRRLVRACLFRGKPKCGCTGSAACALAGKDRTQRECEECVARYGW